MDIGGGLILTTDNSGGIGEKPADLIHVPDEVTAYFAARVALVEQWAANAEPVTVLIHNFSGENSWNRYVAGVEKAFSESSMALPKITGSTETNMEMVQSAVAITMIGKQSGLISPIEGLIWRIYGTPLVGDEVVERVGEIAQLQILHDAYRNRIIERLWPVGSKGILHEIQKITGTENVQVQTELEIEKSAGPATAVLLGIRPDRLKQAEQHFGNHLHRLEIK